MLQNCLRIDEIDLGIPKNAGLNQTMTLTEEFLDYLLTDLENFQHTMTPEEYNAQMKLILQEVIKKYHEEKELEELLGQPVIMS